MIVGILALALVTAMSAGLAVIWARRNLFMVIVSGESMEPTHRAGDKVLVRRVSADRIRTGDVVVADPSADTEQRLFLLALRQISPGRQLWPGVDHAAIASAGRGDNRMIKRVAAVPGEPRPAAVPPQTDESVVPPGYLVLLGDNPDQSLDSRHFGYIPATDIIGKVILAG